MEKTQRGFNGWPVFWMATVLLAGLAMFLYSQAPGTDGVRLVIRATARTSLAFFLLAFTASALAQLWPSGLTGWIRANRRQLGLAFAMSHFIHLLAIVTLARSDPAVFWSLSNPASITAGTFGYIAIALLAATSFDRMVRWLGPTTWQKLHFYGVWFIWISFIITNGKRIPTQSIWYAVPILFLLAALVIRSVAKRRR